MPILYHATSPDAAQRIQESGFVDHRGQYGTPEELTGVFLSDTPLCEQEGAKGEVILRVTLDLPESELDCYELVEADKPYREWCIPADFLIRNAKVEILTDEEVEAAGRDRYYLDSELDN